jgi:L-amino acid N-acyltransferase YncA
MTIRSLEERDVDGVVSIFNDIVLHEDSFINEEPMSPDGLKELLRGQVVCYVAVEDDEVVGFYYLHPLFKGRANHIGNATYGVAKRHRRKGIGLALGKHSVAVARQIGFRYLFFVSVLSANKGSNRIWEKLGFERISSIRFGYRNHDGDFVATSQYLLELDPNNRCLTQRS